MNDLISRQDAIDSLNHIIQKDEDGEWDTEWNDAVHDSIGIIKDEPSADISDQLDDAYAHGYTYAESQFYKALAEELKRTKPQWIPVSERLPKYCEAVLTCDCFGVIEVLSLEQHIANAHWEDSHADWIDLEGIVAWMPLPEPYRGESE